MMKKYKQLSSSDFFFFEWMIQKVKISKLSEINKSDLQLLLFSEAYNCEMQRNRQLWCDPVIFCAILLILVSLFSQIYKRLGEWGRREQSIFLPQNYFQWTEAI